MNLFRRKSPLKEEAAIQMYLLATGQLTEAVLQQRVGEIEPLISSEDHKWDGRAGVWHTTFASILYDLTSAHAALPQRQASRISEAILSGLQEDPKSVQHLNIKQEYLDSMSQITPPVFGIANALYDCLTDEQGNPLEFYMNKDKRMINSLGEMLQDITSQNFWKQLKRTYNLVP